MPEPPRRRNLQLPLLSLLLSGLAVAAGILAYLSILAYQSVDSDVPREVVVHIWPILLVFAVSIFARWSTSLHSQFVAVIKEGRPIPRALGTLERLRAYLANEEFIGDHPEWIEEIRAGDGRKASAGNG